MSYRQEEFDKVMTSVEGFLGSMNSDEREAYKQVWNAACEECAQLAHDCGEYQIAGESREFKV
jgi:hypothetical protein